jgi:hypothetical protein
MSSGVHAGARAGQLPDGGGGPARARPNPESGSGEQPTTGAPKPCDTAVGNCPPLDHIARGLKTRFRVWILCKVHGGGGGGGEGTPGPQLVGVVPEQAMQSDGPDTTVRHALVGPGAARGVQEAQPTAARPRTCF